VRRRRWRRQRHVIRRLVVEVVDRLQRLQRLHQRRIDLDLRFVGFDLRRIELGLRVQVLDARDRGTAETGGPGLSGGSSGRFSIFDGSLQPSGRVGSSAMMKSPVGGPGGIGFAGLSSGGLVPAALRGIGVIVGASAPTVIVQSG
jgi:hypothetical protein